MTQIPLRDLDIIYISFDEPAADRIYGDLCAMAPVPIQRVHGVKGFHNAHARAAEIAQTDRFVTIDGDNVVSWDLFEASIEVGEADRDVVYSFKARNNINGLVYGNGGVKVWPRQLVLNVPTHEASPNKKGSTDFCWVYRYMQVDTQLSTVHYHSALQAFRSGYREGVKMSFVNGEKPRSWRDVTEFAERFYPHNLARLKIWASVGADVEYGPWAIYGARMGLLDLWCGNEDGAQTLIADYESFNQVFEGVFSDSDPVTPAQKLRSELNDALPGLGLVDLSPEQSVWFKSVYHNPPRAGIMLPDLPPVVLP